MPDRWQHRPARWNAAISRYSKDQIQVVYVRPRSGAPMLVITSPWGPNVVNTDLGAEEPDLETYRRLYLGSFPVPLPEPARRSSIFERLRRIDT